MMNIETLLQAAQILENQQSILPQNRLANGECPTPTSSIPTSILSSTTLHTNPVLIPPTTSLVKNEQYPQLDLNLNLHHLTHLARSSQQYLTTNRHDDELDDEDDEMDQNTERNSEISSRTQTTCFRDREIHNRLEKHRRAHLKDCFDQLKAEVPCQRDRKVTNLQILNMAIKYVQSLNRKEREYENEVAMLTARNNELQRRLGTLKSELNSEGHDVDTWLDTCSDIDDRSVSTRTASEAEMYRAFDDDDEEEFDCQSKFHNGHDHPSHHEMNNSHAIDSKILSNNRKTSTRQRPRPSKRKLSAIPTTNLLQTLPVPTRAENLLEYNVARHLRLDQPCNLLTTVKNTSSSTLTPITDIRYEIVDMFTKGTTSHLQQAQQQHISPLPSIASLINRHSSPIVSPTKQTIGINTELLTTSTTNILHQPVATS